MLWLISARATTYRPTAELNQLTGIAAILTFPLDIEVVEAEEREAKEEEERRKVQHSYLALHAHVFHNTQAFAQQSFATTKNISSIITY